MKAIQGRTNERLRSEVNERWQKLPEQVNLGFGQRVVLSFMHLSPLVGNLSIALILLKWRDICIADMNELGEGRCNYSLWNDRRKEAKNE